MEVGKLQEKETFEYSLSMEIPVKLAGRKRKHALSENIAQNQPCAMVSKTRVGRPKVNDRASNDRFISIEDLCGLF